MGSCLRGNDGAGRRIVRHALVALTLAVGVRSADAQAPASEPAAIAALNAGRYDEAIAALRELAARPDASADTRRRYLRALVEVGKDVEAETTARAWAAEATQGAALATSLGELLAMHGRGAEAQQAFERALAARASDSLTARVDLALLLHDRGERDAARMHLRRVAAATAAAADGATLTPDQWLAVGVAQRALAREEPNRYRLALQAFDRQRAASRTDAEGTIRAGDLFLEKYNADDARKSFEEVLRANPRHPRALLGLARVMEFDGAGGSIALAESSLTVNPRLADAHLFLAAQRLDAEDYAGAEAGVNRALAVDSTSLDALTLLGAVRYLQGDSAATEVLRRRVLARDPQHAAFYATLAELAARHRQYAAAASLAGRGVAIDRTSWRNHALRGINQLRLGHVDSAKASLDAAFAGDPYDVWTKNTLDLLDATKGYRTERVGHFTLVADTTEASLLSLYAVDLLEEGYERFATRYGYRPPTTVRLEIYRSHADFSVRSVGLTGLGALGVSFGPVLAMDAPSAREVGAFHWGATAWHELAHTFTLGVTDDRVPRWLSEGLSVLEERRARPGWGDGPTPSFLAAWQSGKVPPLAALNEGFIHPKFPEQVLFSYYAASLVCELIERDFGIAGINKLLAAYKDGLETPAAFVRGLGVDVPNVARRLDTFMQERFKGALVAASTPGGGEFGLAMAAGDSLVEAADTVKAIAAFQRAKAIFPDYAQGDSPYARLAKLYVARGDRKRAADELTQLTAHNATHYAAHIELADLRAQLGDTTAAAAALEQAIWVSPYDPAVHERLATFVTQLGDRKRAVRERRAIVALAPVDVAGARYQLARALLDAGDVPAAKREVIRALERAPSYAPAQELLLRIVDGAR
jgi:tetratricopeptide (TPR) repeat protein